MRNTIIILLLGSLITSFNGLAGLLLQITAHLEAIHWRRKMLAELSRRRRG